MPGSFDEREKSYETKWVHDQELRFRLHSRRNRMVASWAASELGLKGADADKLAQEIVAAEFDRNGDEAIFARVRKAFDEGHLTVSDHAIRRKMADLLDTAKADLERELKR
jgi:hypothetical protein